MRTVLAAGLVCLLFSHTAARAQTTATLTFATVDGVEWYGTAQLRITGILQGEAAASTRIVYANSALESAAACERKALLAMSKPGQYVLTVTQPSATSAFACGLTRAAP